MRRSCAPGEGEPQHCLLQIQLTMEMANHCPHVQWSLSNTNTLGPIKCVLIREMSSFQGANNRYLYEVGTWSSVLIREVSLIQGCPLRGVPLYTDTLAVEVLPAAVAAGVGGCPVESAAAACEAGRPCDVGPLCGACPAADDAFPAQGAVAAWITDM